LGFFFCLQLRRRLQRHRLAGSEGYVFSSQQEMLAEKRYLPGKAKQTVSFVSFARAVPWPTFQLLLVTQHVSAIMSKSASAE
jgi:hypothetical protein